jgi:hypothetical protein
MTRISIPLLLRDGLFTRRRLGPALAGFALWLTAAVVRAADQPIAVFPETPYDAHIIYQSLAVFWIAIIGLIVIIRMKLKEIERIQALGADREDPDAPLLQ